MVTDKTKEQKKYQCLFGPVPSRRFGRSLGIDLVPLKTCSFNCLFCQLGPNSETTLIRDEYVPLDRVLQEIDLWLEKDGQADILTLSGSGEPTLHSRFGQVLEYIKKKTTLPTLLLTNGSTLSLSEVRPGASKADLVKTSLSAWDQKSLLQINRPHPDLKFQDLLQGQIDFRVQYKGRLFLEVMVIQGFNDREDQISKIATLAKKIQPDKIQLNTVVRPPADKSALLVPQEKLELLTDLFEPKAEIIAEWRAAPTSQAEVDEQTILSMLQRRPCTAEDIAQVHGLHLNEVSKYLGRLLRTEQIIIQQGRDQVYYVAKSG